MAVSRQKHVYESGLERWRKGIESYSLDKEKPDFARGVRSRVSRYDFRMTGGGTEYTLSFTAYGRRDLGCNLLGEIKWSRRPV